MGWALGAGVERSAHSGGPSSSPSSSLMLSWHRQRRRVAISLPGCHGRTCACFCCAVWLRTSRCLACCRASASRLLGLHAALARPAGLMGRGPRP